MGKIPNQRSQLYMTQGEGDVERISPSGRLCSRRLEGCAVTWAKVRTGQDRRTLFEKDRQMREEGGDKRSLCP